MSFINRLLNSVVDLPLSHGICRLVRTTNSKYYRFLFLKGARERSTTCEVCGRAVGIGRVIRSSYVYRTNTTGKACK